MVKTIKHEAAKESAGFSQVTVLESKHINLLFTHLKDTDYNKELVKEQAEVKQTIFQEIFAVSGAPSLTENSK